jgi:hypothetical protein
VDDFAAGKIKICMVLIQEISAVCRVCGCTEWNACEGGCRWVEKDLCSACALVKAKKSK